MTLEAKAEFSRLKVSVILSRSTFIPFNVATPILTSMRATGISSVQTRTTSVRFPLRGFRLARAVSDPAAILKGLGEPKQSEVQTLYHSGDLTILNVIWAPRMTIMPRNHQM